MERLLVALIGSGVITTLVLILLVKPALILLALSWMGVSVSWGSFWSWLGAVLLSAATAS